jgi:hypothetical protein
VASPADASRAAAALADQGTADAALWDAILLGAAELSLRRPGLVSLHAVTSMNAARHAYARSHDRATRRLLLFQAAAWITHFRGEFGLRGQDPRVDGPRIDRLERETEESTPALERLFEEMGRDRAGAAALALAYARRGGSPAAYMDFARDLVYKKGNDVHDYKVAAAAFEEFGLMSPAWRPHLLAASACHLKGPSAKDAVLYERIQEAMRRL